VVISCYKQITADGFFRSGKARSEAYPPVALAFRVDGVRILRRDLSYPGSAGFDILQVAAG
jgi:hypothetical protein